MKEGVRAKAYMDSQQAVQYEVLFEGVGFHLIEPPSKFTHEDDWSWWKADWQDGSSLCWTASTDALLVIELPSVKSRITHL